MTSQSKHALESSPDSSRAVAEYLRKHPEFFQEHPYLLGELEVPHQTGDAVSLVERQVSVLRVENQALKSKFQSLVTIAGENEELGKRMHDLTLQLIDAADIEQLVTTIEARLKEDFGADWVALRMFAEPAIANGERAEFVGEDAPLRALFEIALQERRSVCGRLNGAQQQALFSQAEIGSAVVLPLASRHWEGVLVIASEDPQRYSVDMGTTLLAQLGDVATLVIAPWIKAPPA